MVRFQPDAAREVARLGARIEELERTVRHGKAAGNMRDLADANLAKASDGDVPAYDSASGTWKPGSSTAATAYFGSLTSTVPVPGNTLELYEEYNHGGLFTFAGSGPPYTAIGIARASIVRCDAYCQVQAEASTAELRVDGFATEARRVNTKADGPGTYTDLMLSFTDRWNAGTMVFIGVFFGGATNRPVQRVSLAVTQVRPV